MKNSIPEQAKRPLRDISFQDIFRADLKFFAECGIMNRLL